MTAIHYTVRTMKVGIDLDGSGSGAPTYVECAVTGVTENEAHDEITGATACADGVFTDVGPSRYTLTIGYNVKHDPASFHRLLREHAGKSATVEIEPDPVGDPGRKITYAVVLVAGGATMTVGQTATASTTLPVNGTPTYTDPTQP